MEVLRLMFRNFAVSDASPFVYEQLRGTRSFFFFKGMRQYLPPKIDQEDKLKNRN